MKGNLFDLGSGGRTDAQERVHGGADHRHPSGIRGRGRSSLSGAVSQTTFYKWRAKLGGMTVSDGRRLKSLAEENRRLKELLAETMLDVQD